MITRKRLDCNLFVMRNCSMHLDILILKVHCWWPPLPASFFWCLFPLLPLHRVSTWELWLDFWIIYYFFKNKLDKNPFGYNSVLGFLSSPVDLSEGDPAGRVPPIIFQMFRHFISTVCIQILLPWGHRELTTAASQLLLTSPHKKNWEKTIFPVSETVGKK